MSILYGLWDAVRCTSLAVCRYTVLTLRSITSATSTNSSNLPATASSASCPAACRYGVTAATGAGTSAGAGCAATAASGRTGTGSGAAGAGVEPEAAGASAVPAVRSASWISISEVMGGVGGPVIVVVGVSGSEGRAHAEALDAGRVDRARVGTTPLP